MLSEHPSAEYELRAAARAPNIAVMRRGVVAFAARSGATARQLEDIALAVSEALTNVVQYAYRDHDAPGTMAVHAAVADHVLEITVSDDGCGLQPDTTPQHPGLGHALIGQVTDTLTIESPWGVCVRMTFELD